VEKKTNACIVEIDKTERRRGQLPNSKWPRGHVHGEGAMREMLTGEKITELRDFGTLACWVKCERESRLKKT